MLSSGLAAVFGVGVAVEVLVEKAVADIEVAKRRGVQIPGGLEAAAGAKVSRLRLLDARQRGMWAGEARAPSKRAPLRDSTRGPGTD
jgi:hypothetical protein